MLARLSAQLYQRLFGGSIWDEPYKTFFPTVRRYLLDAAERGKILDAACGSRNVYLQRLVAAGDLRVESLIGLDIDGSVRQANELHRTFLIQDLHQPLQTDDLAAVISLYTWEHLHAPDRVLHNLHAALQAQGVLVIIAAQRLYYVSLIERWLPTRLRALAWRVLKSRRERPYPAYFRLCSAPALQQAAQAAGFDLLEYTTLDPAPIWFKRVPPVFVLLCFWTALVNRLEALAPLRGTFLAVLRKRAQA